MAEIGNRKERLRVREAGASAAGRGQRPYVSFPDRSPKQVRTAVRWIPPNAKTIEFQRGKNKNMEINDKLVSYVAELAHLKIDEAQREQAAADLARMIGYVDQLSELDTTGVEPMSHAFPVVNVFREDEVKPSMERELILKNAPDVKDGCFLVPKTVE